MESVVMDQVVMQHKQNTQRAQKLKCFFSIFERKYAFQTPPHTHTHTTHVHTQT